MAARASRLPRFLEKTFCMSPQSFLSCFIAGAAVTTSFVAWRGVSSPTAALVTRAATPRRSRPTSSPAAWTWSASRTSRRGSARCRRTGSRGVRRTRTGSATTPRRRSRVPAAALAADLRRSHQAAAVDRPGGQRRARQEYRVGPDRPALEARRIPVTYLSGSIRTMLSRTTDRHGSGRLLRTRDCATVRK